MADAGNGSEVAGCDGGFEQPRVFGAARQEGGQQGGNRRVGCGRGSFHKLLHILWARVPRIDCLAS